MVVDDVIYARALILPVVTPASTMANATTGTICVSGAKLYFYTGSVWSLVTSA